MIRTRLNSRERKRLYKRHVAMYGEKCRICGRTPRLHGVKLVVDRINNDDPEYTFEKTQLICKGCNHRKNPRGKGKKNCSRPLNVCVEVKKN